MCFSTVGTNDAETSALHIIVGRSLLRARTVGEAPCQRRACGPPWASRQQGSAWAMGPCNLPSCPVFPWPSGGPFISTNPAQSPLMPAPQPHAPCDPTNCLSVLCAGRADPQARTRPHSPGALLSGALSRTQPPSPQACPARVHGACDAPSVWPVLGTHTLGPRVGGHLCCSAPAQKARHGSGSCSDGHGPRRVSTWLPPCP